MGFFDIFRKRDAEEIALPDGTMQIDDALLKALLRNETITREKAMTLPAVAGAVDLIANCVACMPVKLYKREDGKVKEVENDPRVRLLNVDTGDTLDAWQMKKAMVEDYLLGKGGYACIVRPNNSNGVTGLHYVEESEISIVKLPDPIFKRYTIMVYDRVYQPYEFIKLLRNTKDGASGEGLTVEVSKAIEAAYHTLLYQLSLARTGGNKRGFLKAQRKLGQPEIDTLKEAWAKMYSNDGEEKVIVLNNGIEFQEATASSVEMQLNESRRTFDDQMNALFHIHPENFEATFKEAIFPIVRAFETALNRDLLLESEKDNMFFGFVTREIIKASITERYNAYKTAKDTGFMTVNEIRDQENMNSIEGMDVINVGLSAVLYDVNTGKYYTPNTGETTDPNTPTPEPEAPPGNEPEGG